MPIDQPYLGQRWVSDTEPELGLGIILKALYGKVEVIFPAANEHRQYALQSAPLRRVQFKVGDKIKSHNGEEFVVEDVEEKEHLLIYKTATRDVPEAELSDAISFSTPEDRLLAGQTDELFTYQLRLDALQLRSQLRQSPVRGFIGGRVDLIPHQMFIAHEVTSRLLPRVLLADEVGLGKTIEASLILHRLQLTGRASRVLIVLPEALVHQWFVELFRRFHLLFSIFDEERCLSIVQHDAAANPFLDSQLVICSLDFLTQHEQRAQQAVAAGWDLVIVDEAHHLEWAPDQASPAYTLVESLARVSPGLLLLTATPQQLGPEGHFARLRLLDPDRYDSLEKFVEEAEHYQQVAKAADRLLEGKTLTKTEEKLFSSKSTSLKRHSKALAAGDEAERGPLVDALLDEFGIGRVMFRNTRTALKGFPERAAKLYPLKLKKDQEELEAKVKWLATLLRDLDEQKVLLICKTRALVDAINELLLREVNVPTALFHEGLTLMQRDRNAAHFAEEEEGARILICSEIGSEGRNFQFAHHLVLFDLPANPELLEQRIGRLDRIGQTSTIHIHVPYIAGTAAEVLARWYHDGMDAFQKHPHGALEVQKGVEEDLSALLTTYEAKKVTALIKKTQTLQKQIGKKLEQGHDRLLELSSCRAGKAEEVIDQVRAQDSDAGFEDFFLRLMDHLGMQVEDMSHRSYLLTPGQLMANALPAMPPEGLSITFDRTRALSRENVAFVSGDHPLTLGALDLMLGGESGNASFAVWKGSGAEGLLLEASFVVECPAPPALHVDRFLSPAPVHVAVDHAMKDQTDKVAVPVGRLAKGDIGKLLDRGAVRKKILPGMVQQAKTLAEPLRAALAEAAVTAMESQLQSEIERLEDLQAINDHVQPAEIEALRQQKEQLRTAIEGARLRLDALRFIWRMP